MIARDILLTILTPRYKGLLDGQFVPGKCYCKKDKQAQEQ